MNIKTVKELENQNADLLHVLRYAERYITVSVEQHGRDVARVCRLDPEAHAAIFVAECATLQRIRAAIAKAERV